MTAPRDDTGTPAHLHRVFPELRETLPREVLGHGPTPVRLLEASSAAGHAPVWLKEDGAYGTIYGGNKVRKLEWLLPDLQRRGARSIITFGGLGTNHGLATALYAGRCGLRTHLLLVDQPIDAHVRSQVVRLVEAATVKRTATTTGTAVALPFVWLSAVVRDRRPPAFLGPGGSSPLGALGCVEAAFEIAAQVDAGALPLPSHVVVPVGSAGTAAGLALGFRIAGLPTRVVGIVVAGQLRPDPPTIARLARRSARLLRRRGARERLPALAGEDLDVHTDWLGPGYGHPTPAAANARERALADGLRLDPVYGAKAFAGLLELNGNGAFGQGPVLFIDTHDRLSTGEAQQRL